MSEIYVDTDKMRTCGNEILELVEEFKRALTIKIVHTAYIF